MSAQKQSTKARTQTRAPRRGRASSDRSMGRRAAQNRDLGPSSRTTSPFHASAFGSAFFRPQTSATSWPSLAASLSTNMEPSCIDLYVFAGQSNVLGWGVGPLEMQLRGLARQALSAPAARACRPPPRRPSPPPLRSDARRELRPTRGRSPRVVRRRSRGAMRTAPPDGVSVAAATDGLEASRARAARPAPARRERRGAGAVVPRCDELERRERARRRRPLPTRAPSASPSAAASAGWAARRWSSAPGVSREPAPRGRRRCRGETARVARRRLPGVHAAARAAGCRRQRLERGERAAAPQRATRRLTHSAATCAAA